MAEIGSAVKKLTRVPHLAAALLLLTVAAPARAAQPDGWKTVFTDDFESGLGNWEVASPPDDPGASWSIVKDGSNSVLYGQGHIFALLRGSGWADYRFKARVKVLEGGVNLNFRNSGCVRYFVPFVPALQLGRTSPCSTHTTLVSTGASYNTGQWYTVEIVGVGANVKVYVDSALQIDYTDANPVLFGRPAFESFPDSRVYIDDVEISGPAVLTLANQYTWIKTGGPIGGLGYDVRMRPDKPDTMFVTDTFSGVNVSVDGGRTWQASNTGITARTGTSGDAIPVFCLTIDSRNPDVVWAGTQNARGIYRSTDGGKKWVQKTNGIVEQNGISFRGITVDPNDSNVVYAAAEISSFVWAGASIMGREFDRTKGVVYRTRDGGQNWTAIWRGDNLARYVWIDPRNTSVVYVSTGIFDREAANSDLVNGVPGGVGIVKTTDGGQTWQALNRPNGFENLYVGTLFLHPQNPDILLAGAGVVGSSTGAGIYLSTDKGARWQRGTLAGSGQVIEEVITSVEFAFSDPRIAYAGSSSFFYRSSDGGHTWTIRAGGPPSNDYGPPGIWTGFPIDLQVDPRNPDRVFINNYGGGNFLSEDGGLTWQVASYGYTGAQLHRVVANSRTNGDVYVTGRSGSFRSPDRGDNWTGLNYIPANFVGFTVVLDPANPSTLLLSSDSTGTLLRSTDGGVHWTMTFKHPLATGDPNNRHGFKSLTFAPSSPRTVYGGVCRTTTESGTAGPSFGVFKSTDGGMTWQDSNDAVSAGQNIHMIAVRPGDENTVYATTYKSGVLKSTDGGHSWKQINQGLGLLDVRSLAIDPSNPAVLYAGIEGGGLYKSTNSGATWTLAATGMDPAASIRDIAIDPSSPQTVYAADYRTGVYWSADGGKTWVQINNGLSTRAVKALALTPSGGTLYAATEGEGLFRLDIVPSSGAAATLSITDGDAQTAAVGTAFPKALKVKLTDSYGAAVPSIQVSFSAAPGDVALSSAVASTDSNGEARVTATPQRAGALTVTASLGSLSATFHLTGTATAVSHTPRVEGVSPASGAGAARSFTFTFSDPGGWQDLDVVNILVNRSLDGRNACYLAYSRAYNVLYLVNDAGAGLLPGMVLNGSGAVGNNQCGISGAGSSAAGSGTTLTLTLNMTFGAGFAGNQIVYLAARDAAQNNSGWRPMGVWQVPGAASATSTEVVGVTPASGTGLGPTAFTFNFSDTNGYQDLGVENILVNTALDGRHACYLAFARPLNVLYLVNDAGDGLLPGKSLGTAGSLQNSQCTVTWGGNPVVASGTGLVLSLNIAFAGGFGPNLIMYAAARDSREGNNTGWQAMGAWMAQ
jgi:photosystem II stability/assembly factor-like uncharacterized protein